jgi:hypothetical protein
MRGNAVAPSTSALTPQQNEVSTSEVEMKRIVVVGCLVAAWMLRPGVAAADSLTYTGLGSGEWVNLKIGNVTETGWAGEINWNLTVNGITKAVTTYCVDLFDDAKLTQVGTYESTGALDANPSLSHGAGANAGTIAAYLVDTNGASAHGNNIQAAGLQIAIWQDMFGANSFSVLSTTGNYTAIMNAVAGYSLPSGPFSASAGYFDVINGAGIGSAANGQDQIVVGTPEPGLVLLLGFALIGMFVYQRRMQLQPRAIRVD